MRIYTRLALQAMAVVAVVMLLLLLTDLIVIHAFVRDHLLLCLSVTAVLLVVVFLTFYAIAYHALLPLREMAQVAEGINERQLHQRLPERGIDDEFTTLTVALNAMLDRMEQSFDEQKMFVSNVSHEMRTPLAAIIAGLDLSLQKERTAQEYVGTIANALDDAHRINRLIDGLLNLAKASYNREQIQKEAIRLDELLLDARATILKGHPQYHIELIFEQDCDDDDSLITVMGNVYLLTVAFSNLIENNCKYSSDKSSFIQISYWEQLAIVRLSDSGIGMSDDDKAHLFTLFYRGDKERTVEGYGIGMVLSQRIIHLHEGTIAVYSEHGKGTTYVIELPHV